MQFSVATMCEELAAVDASEVPAAAPPAGLGPYDARRASRNSARHATTGIGGGLRPQRRARLQQPRVGAVRERGRGGSRGGERAAQTCSSGAWNKARNKRNVWSYVREEKAQRRFAMQRAGATGV